MAATLTVTVPARMAETSRFGWKKENEEGKTKTKRTKRMSENEWQISLVKQRGENKDGKMKTKRRRRKQRTKRRAFARVKR